MADASAAGGGDRDALVGEIITLQDNIKELLARLATVKGQYEAQQAENDMLQQYIQNLKSTTSELKKS